MGGRSDGLKAAAILNRYLSLRIYKNKPSLIIEFFSQVCYSLAMVPNEDLIKVLLAVFTLFGGKAIMTEWQTQGRYQYEYDENGYTGWCRYVGGRLSGGRWPAWNNQTGAKR